MPALVLAAVIAVAPAPPPEPAACPAARTTATAVHSPARPQKLADLPDANLELTVLRSIGGCPYRQVIRFNVSTGDGAQDGIRVPGLRGVLVPAGPGRVTPAEPARDGR